MVAISVVLAFVFILAVDFIVLKFQGRTHPAFEKTISESSDRVSISDQNEIPDNIILTRNHTWLKKISGDTYQLGIDNFLYMTFKKLLIKQLPEPGAELKMGEAFIESQVGNKTLKVLSPVDGIIISVNKNKSVDKTLDPYSQWQIIIKTEDIGAKNNILSGLKTASWMKEEFERLEEFVSAHSINSELVGTTMYDGGKPFENAAEKIIENNLEEFEKEFLKL